MLKLIYCKGSGWDIGIFYLTLSHNSLYKQNFLCFDIDLYAHRKELKKRLDDELKQYILNDEKETPIEYPVDQYPDKIKSINFDKVGEYEGMLTGIKGQYLYIDHQHVVNMRKYSGYYFQIKL